MARYPSGHLFPQSKEGRWGSIPALTVCGIWKNISCYVHYVKERKVQGNHHPGYFLFRCLFCLLHYDSKKVEWKTDKFTEMICLSNQVGVCTFSDTSLTMVLWLVLVTAQTDRPTQRVSRSIGMGWRGGRRARLLFWQHVADTVVLGSHFGNQCYMHLGPKLITPNFYTLTLTSFPCTWLEFQAQETTLRQYITFIHLGIGEGHLCSD